MQFGRRLDNMKGCNEITQPSCPLFYHSNHLKTIASFFEVLFFMGPNMSYILFVWSLTAVFNNICKSFKLRSFSFQNELLQLWFTYTKCYVYLSFCKLILICLANPLSYFVSLYLLRNGTMRHVAFKKIFVTTTFVIFFDYFYSNTKIVFILLEFCIIILWLCRVFRKPVYKRYW